MNKDDQKEHIKRLLRIFISDYEKARGDISSVVMDLDARGMGLTVDEQYEILQEVNPSGDYNNQAAIEYVAAFDLEKDG